MSREPAGDRWDPARYEAELGRGLVLSGEDSSFFARGRVARVAEVCRHAGLAPSALLEFGCGTGINLPWLRDAFPGARLVGLERSPEMLSAARGRFAGEPIELVRDEAFDETGTIDLVFVNGVFHHIEPSERPAAIAAIRQCMAPGGLLALFENNPLNPGAMWVMKRIPFDRDARPIWPWALVRLVREAGFTVPRVRSYFYFPRALRLLRPLEPALERLPLGAQYAVYARTG